MWNANRSCKKNLFYLILQVHSNKMGGTFTTSKTIGQGAYAVVKLATHTPSNQTFAIKIFDKTR